MDNKTRQAFMDSVFGENKNRDFRILEYKALNPHKEYAELINDLALDISVPRVCQIVKDNQDLILKLFAQINPLYFKEGRAMELVGMYHAAIDKSDKFYALECLRKLLEGDSDSIGGILTNRDTDEPELRRNDIQLQERVQSALEASRGR